MKTIEIKGGLRKDIGKVASRLVRRAGNVPCEIYGKENIHIQMDEREVGKVVFSPEVFKINIDIEGKKYDVVLRDIQFHPVTDKIVHVDFEQVDDNKLVNIEIPVKYAGTAPGVMAGGKLKMNARKLSVKSLIKNIPAFIEVNIGSLNVGDSIRVKDVQYEGVTITESPNNVLAAVITSRAVVETPATAAPAAKAAAPKADAKK